MVTTAMLTLMTELNLGNGALGVANYAAVAILNALNVRRSHNQNSCKRKAPKMSNPTSIISKYIEEVRRLDKEATPGPWTRNGPINGDCSYRIRGPKCNLDTHHDSAAFFKEDCDLVCSYRTSAPRLAEALEVARICLTQETDIPSMQEIRMKETLHLISHILSDEKEGSNV